ncbi:hypothetical protein IFM89_010248, partial [Coptis chinensis]
AGGILGRVMVIMGMDMSTRYDMTIGSSSKASY